MRVHGQRMMLTYIAVQPDKRRRQPALTIEFSENHSSLYDFQQLHDMQGN